jgi:uncharacterized protein YllA (UPF0747 family)
VDTGGFSCGYIPVDAALVEILQTYFATIHQTEWTGDLKEMVLSCYRKGYTLGESSRLLAEKMFHGFPLKIFDPMDESFRAFSKTFLINDAEGTPDGAQCNLFCIINKKRLAVFKKDGGYVLRDGEPVDLSQHDLVPNVKTRNVCQDAFFKNRYYVAGPGEVSYISELDDQYRFHRVRKAEVRPRMSVTLLEPRVIRSLRQLDMEWKEFLNVSGQELANRKLGEISDYDFSRARELSGKWTEAYVEKLNSLSLETKKIRKNLQKMVKESLGEKRAGIKVRHKKIVSDILYLSGNLFPFGKRQERVFNIFYYMNLFGGTGFLLWLYEKYDDKKSFLEIKDD